MTTHTDLRRPSDDLGVLADQLLREVERLEQEGDDAEEPELYRAYLRYAESLAWNGVARGDLEAPRRLLDHLRAAQPLVDAHRPEIGRPLERAALEVHWTIRSLYLAVDTLAEKQVEVRLADRRSETEREILKVLLKSGGEYMRRGDIHERLSPQTRPTPARVSQILAELFRDGLLQRVHGRAQGNSNASFYALSPRGINLCSKLEMVPTGSKTEDETPGARELREELAASRGADPAEPLQNEVAPRAIPSADPGLAWVQKLVSEALAPEANKTRRGVAIGILANSEEIPFERIMEALEYAVSGKEEDKAIMTLLEQVIAQIVLTRSGVIRSELTFGRCITLLLGRRSPVSPPSSAILSARRQAACVASEKWCDRGQGIVREEQAMITIHDR